MHRIVAEVQAHSPALVFVDSFRSVALASETEGGSNSNLQHFVQQLGVLMTSWQATTFLLGEYFSENDAIAQQQAMRDLFYIFRVMCAYFLIVFDECALLWE